MIRIVPVVDEEGNPNCSFSARADQRNGIFRKTMCVEPNEMQDQLFVDNECSEESNREGRLITRGVCIPLPLPGQSNDQRRQAGEGGGQRRNPGEGGRRLQDAPLPPSCDGEFQQGYTWESLVDLWSELLCDDNNAEDGPDADLDDPDRPNNPCRDLDRNDCISAEACDLQEGVCVWNQAPANRRNLYAVYDWQYLIEDGEKTDVEWCYSDGIVLADQADYNALCDAQDTKEGCEANGCKKFKENKKSCKPETKKINCKNLGPKGAKKNDASVKEICDQFLTLGCSWSEKKGCKGKVKF